MWAVQPLPHDPSIDDRAAEILRDWHRQINRSTDRMFALLMAIQWIGGIIAAVVISPQTWAGSISETHIHVWSALACGGLLSGLPIYLALRHPGDTWTRYVIAVAQMLWSALLIHLSGGRIETHFHEFGSLAFLAFYRDWKLLIPATAVVAIDHVVRGVYWPQSVYGVLTAAPWRSLEHSAWVVFEDIFLIYSCRKSEAEMGAAARQRAQLSHFNVDLESRIALRTAQLKESEDRFARAVQGTADGLWDWHIASDRMWCADRFKELLGYEAHEFDLTFEAFKSQIDDADRERALRAVREHLDHDAPIDLECRLYTKQRQVRWFRVRGRAFRDALGRPIQMAGSIQDITEHKSAQLRDRVQLAAMEAAANAVVVTDASSRILWVNEAFTRMTGYRREEAVGAHPSVLKSGKHDAEFYSVMWRTLKEGRVWHGELWNRRKDGKVYREEMTITPLRDNESGAITHFVAIKNDVTEQRAREAEARHQQKLSSIGQLAAGIAHEINTPTQFVGDNLRFLHDSLGDLLQVLGPIAKPLAAEGANSPDARCGVVQSDLERLDYEFLSDEIPKAIAQSLEGVDRIATIVRAMKDFSHPGQEGRSAADLNKAIESTVTVARNEWKYVADVVTELDPDLPPVPCYLSEVNQTVLNMIINAAHAIADVVGDASAGKGKITIRTRRLEEAAEIRISDTGTGIKPEHRDKIFDHFFTTKEVGKGTGQGLSMAYATVVEKHGGAINLETEVGKGTTFIITLPLASAEQDAADVEHEDVANPAR